MSEKKNLIDEVAREKGLGVYREPWKYDVTPDAVNETGSQFYILKDLSNYLKKNPVDGEIVEKLKKAFLLRAYNPATGDTDLFLKNGGEILPIEEQSDYWSLCAYLDILRAHYIFSEEEK